MPRRTQRALSSRVSGTHDAMPFLKLQDHRALPRNVPTPESLEATTEGTRVGGRSPLLARTIQRRNLLLLHLAGKNVPAGPTVSESENVNNETKINAARRGNKKKLLSSNNKRPEPKPPGTKLRLKDHHHHNQETPEIPETMMLSHQEGPAPPL
jgi:hypothetical protein